MLYLAYNENNEKLSVNYRPSCPYIYVDIIALPNGACIASIRSRCYPAEPQPPSERRMPAILSSRQRTALRLAWRFMAPYRWRMLGALVALLFTAAITLSLGQGIRLLVDQGFLTASPELLNRYILLFFVLVLGLAVGTFVRFYLVSWIGERFVADIRKRVFDHLIELHPGFYETNRGSEIQSRLTADTTLLQTVIGSSLSMALRNA